MRAEERWEEAAEHWVRFTRHGADATFAWNCEAFLGLVPEPRGLTLDLGCGEGRITRLLSARGHPVIGVDASEQLVRHARRSHPEGDYRVADAGALTLGDECVDLVVAFMSLQDIEDAAAAVRESARVLRPGGSSASRSSIRWRAPASSSSGTDGWSSDSSVRTASPPSCSGRSARARCSSSTVHSSGTRGR